MLGDVTLFATVPGSEIFDVLADRSKPGSFILVLKAGLYRLFPNGTTQHIKNWPDGPTTP